MNNLASQRSIYLIAQNASLSELDLRPLLWCPTKVLEERAICAVLPLLHCHREFLQGLALVSAFPQDALELAREGTLVVFTCEECDGLARLASTSRPTNAMPKGSQVTVS